MTYDEKFRDRRGSSRLPTSIAAVAQSTQGAVQRLEISDLSPEGCAVVVAGPPLVAGTVYGIKMEGLEGLVSTARWTAGQQAGLQFDRPLYPAIAEHIAARHPRRAA